MASIQSFVLMHPIGCAVFVAGVALCWLLWLFLAFAVHEKVKRNEFVSISRRLLPLGMLVSPVALLALFLWMFFDSSSEAKIPSLDAPRYSISALSRLDEQGKAQPLEDGKYALYRKYANGTTAGFGVVLATPEGIRSFPLDASGAPLVEAQPQEAYSMVPYGVHSLPAFHGILLSHEPTEQLKDFTSIKEPYIDADIAPQAFPFLYVDVSDGKGTVRTGYLTNENAGACVLLYGTWAEPVVTSLVLRGFSREYIAEIIASTYPHAFLNGTIPLPVLAHAAANAGAE